MKTPLDIELSLEGYGLGWMNMDSYDRHRKDDCKWIFVSITELSPKDIDRLNEAGFIYYGVMGKKDIIIYRNLALVKRYNNLKSLSSTDTINGDLWSELDDTEFVGHNKISQVVFKDGEPTDETAVIQFKRIEFVPVEKVLDVHEILKSYLDSIPDEEPSDIKP